MLNKKKPNRFASFGLPAALFLASLTFFSSRTAIASEIANSRPFGLGGILGQPTGVTIKYFFAPEHAVTAALGFSWWGGHNFHIHADYGYHFMLTQAQHFDLPLYVGAGLKFFYFYSDRYHPYWEDDWRDRDYHRAGLGIRVPIGIAFHLNEPTLGIFVEIVPGFAFLPWLDGFVDGGVGLRYYF
jgi:hypothetical protein